MVRTDGPCAISLLRTTRGSTASVLVCRLNDACLRKASLVPASFASQLDILASVLHSGFLCLDYLVTEPGARIFKMKGSR